MAHCPRFGPRQDQRHKMLTSRGGDIGQLRRAQFNGAYMVGEAAH